MTITVTNSDLPTQPLHEEVALPRLSCGLVPGVFLQRFGGSLACRLRRIWTAARFCHDMQDFKVVADVPAFVL
jgi:hypothetical protein